MARRRAVRKANVVQSCAVGQIARGALVLTVVLGTGCVRSGYSGEGDGALDDGRTDGPLDLSSDGLEPDVPPASDGRPDTSPDQATPADKGPPPDQAAPLDKGSPPPDKALPPPDLPPPDKAPPADGPFVVVNPSGTYTVSPTVSYKCAVSLVNFSVSTATFVDDGKTLTVITGPTGPGGGCTVLSGDTAMDGEFTATCVFSGSCTETYSLKAAFTTPTSWTGSYAATYTGSCLNCTSQSWTVTGTHQ